MRARRVAADLRRAAKALGDGQDSVEVRVWLLDAAPQDADPWTWLASQGDETALELVQLLGTEAPQLVEDQEHPRVGVEVPGYLGGPQDNGDDFVG